jgi:hypothetical protein
MDTPKILASLGAIEKAAMIRPNNLLESFEMQQGILARAKEIRHIVEAATTGTTATVTTSAKTPSKPTGAALLAEYRRLSGEARQVFFNKHQDALWSASVAERNAKS